MKDKYTYTEERADDIIKEWQPKLKGTTLTYAGSVMKFIDLTKSASNFLFGRVVINANFTDAFVKEVNDYLVSLGMDTIQE